MILKLLLIILNIIVSIPLYSQLLVNGKVLKLPDKQPISFVNIGIVNSSVGTITNEDGSYSLRIPDRYQNDSVIFSALGFKNVKIPVSIISEKANYIIYLTESPKELQTVTIIGDSWKRKEYWLGNRKFEGSCVYADTVTAGSAMALLIKVNNLDEKVDYPFYIKEAQLMIANNTFNEFKVRTRLYDVDTITGGPGKDILNESVITKSNVENGRLNVDLSIFNIEAKEDFYLVFEWILDKADRKNLFQQYEGFRKRNPDKVRIDYSYIDGEKVPYINYLGNFFAGPSFGISVSRKSLENHICYYRLNSFGKWYRSTSIMAARIILVDQPLYAVNYDVAVESEHFEQLEEMLPYYRIEPQALNFEHDEIALVMQKSDSGFFRQRMQEPIIIEVRRIVNQLSFYAKNSSFYPYRLEMNFSNIKNLLPMVTSKTFIVNPGISRLLIFNVVDPSVENYHYELSMNQTIGDTNNIPSKMYPYLIPVDRQKDVNLVSLNPEDKNNYIGDVFKMNLNDTVYIMRKGIVTATPNMEIQIDRISNEETLEIRHSDGTIMVYKNLNPQNIFINAGDNVYPGQPLGKIDSTNTLKVELYMIDGNDRLYRLNIHYFSE